MGKLLRLAARAGALAGAIYAIQILCVRPYRCSQLLAEVEARSRQALRAPDGSVVSLLARRNLMRLDQMRDGCSQDIAWHMLYAGNCRLLGRNEDAVREYTEALMINQRPELYLQRGLTRLTLGQTEEAVPDLITAARFNPLVIDDLSGETRERVWAAIH